MTVSIQQNDFDLGLELERLSKHSTDIGAVVSFIGQCRDVSNASQVSSMTIEHYPGMTERHLLRLEAQACDRWALKACLIIHRYGHFVPGDRIVLVVTASKHRHIAFAACQFLIDSLKTQAPFWKKEYSATGEHWVNGPENVPLSVENPINSQRNTQNHSSSLKDLKDVR